ncbi:MAG: VWA domain-containing protein [Crocinitomicaceae bacterium]|nr:VWA domain-containing protein [Crocinitomicaceae bacterium]
MQVILNIRFWEYEFFAPQWLWLLLLLPLLFWVLWKAESKKSGDWKFTGTVESQKKFGSPFIHLIRKLLIVNACLLIGFLVIAMAKPYNWNDAMDSNHDYKNGIDIILTIDISGSMLETDFQPNRIEVAKKLAKEFIDGRKGDRIGLVAFAGEAYTACPATTDYDVLKKQLDGLNCYANIEGGTAIGLGLGTAVTRLRNDSIPSKVVILLTDGSNNMGDITPEEAAELAKTKNVRVYTIGVGSDNGIVNINTPFGTIQQQVDSDLDEASLKRIAAITGASYFHATDEESLRNIYKEIEKMEKRKIIDHYFQSEPPAMPASFLYAGLFFAVIGWSISRLFFMQND